MRLAVRATVAVLSLVGLLGACGNQTDADPSVALFKSVTQGAQARLNKSAPAPSDSDIRAALEGVGTPILRVESEATRGFTFLAPLGNNQGIATWSSNEFQTVSMRDGVLLATRGFGPDIMAATAPPATQMARGAGMHNRTFIYLDGGDQTVRSQMTCTLSDAGAETVTILGLSYPTRRVTESCVGKRGKDKNDYWFSGGTILQSRQFLVPGQPGVVLQSVIR